MKKSIRAYRFEDCKGYKHIIREFDGDCVIYTAFEDKADYENELARRKKIKELAYKKMDDYINYLRSEEK